MHPSHPASGPNSDRNLLFGILAVQMDFISRDALIQAMHAWVLAKSKSLGQILLEAGALGAERHVLLEALVQEHLKQHGDDPRASLAAVSSIKSVRRQLEEIADPDLGASLAHVSRAPQGDDDIDATRSYSAGTPTSSGLRFRILRPHARGGLGQIYVAHDDELHREVALKEILERHADHPESRARFLLEAEVTGGLEHPGIVPVYGLGQYADGRPFYAMRFIKGDSLKDAIAQFHDADNQKRAAGARALAFRKLLGRFMDVCNALAYAHSRGVLHRDLKPGNIMLGKYGETLVVDWGLAKTVGKKEEKAIGEAVLQPSSASGSETMPGSTIGTPLYMSPEQAAGRHDLLGPASDVYSLGATLYCLLTGQAPFEHKDPGVVLQKVQRGDFPKPSRVKSAVPRALEAICLKAMALQPSDRYLSPRVLADDLERWLGDDPVSVYRERLPARLGRWGRRHRPLMAGVAALLITAVIALTVSTILIDRALKAEQQAKETAVQLAESQDQLGRSQEDLADTLVRTVKSGRLDRAEQRYLQAVAISEKLVRARPEVPAFRRNLATTYNSLGILYRDLKQNDKAEAVYAKALALREQLAGEEGSGDLDNQRALAAVYNNLGELYHIVGPQAQADAYYIKALAAREKLARDHPDVLQYKVDLGGSYGNQGNFARVNRTPAESLGWYAKSVDMLEEVMRAQPGHEEAQQFLRNGYRGRAVALTRLDRHADALEDWDRAIAADRSKDWHADVLQVSRATCLVRLGEHARAVAEVKALAVKEDIKGVVLYDLACFHSLSSSAAGKDPRLPAAAQLAEDAMALLARARTAGFFASRENRNLLRSDHDLDALRGRDDFRRLLQELK